MSFQKRHAHMPRKLLSILLAVVSTLMVVPVASAADGNLDVGARFAHMRLDVTTTSGYAILKVDQSWILDNEVVASDNATVTNNFSAIRIDRVAAVGTASARVEFIVDTTQTQLHLLNADDVVVRLSKAGGGGTATAVLTNLNDRANPLKVVTLHHPGPGELPVQVATVPAGAFFSSVEVDLPRATSDRKVIAAYYPWFSDSGDPRLTRYDDPTLADRPVHERDLDRAGHVAAEVRQAATAGVDGFAVEFGSTHLQEFRHVVDAAAKSTRPFVVSGLLSATLAGKTANPAATMSRWMQDLHAEATAAGSLYHRTDDGSPIVWIWGVSAFTPQQWDFFLADMHNKGVDFAIMHDGAPETYPTQFEGHFRYGLKQQDVDTFAWWWARDAMYLRGRALLDGSTPPLLVTTVSPGYDDCNVREPCTVIDRQDGDRYNATWARALAVDPDIVLITSWNEWFEATSIAPSQRFGSRALWLTWLWAAVAHAG